MTYDIISSGSSGNAVLIDDCILIDCGVSWRQLAPAVPKLKLVLLTHVHQDHFRESTIRRLIRERPALRFAGRPWMVRPLQNAGAQLRSIDSLVTGFWYNYSGWRVRVYDLLHDVPNCGYLIQKDGVKLFYATDTYSLDHISVAADVCLIEGNHREQEIEAKIREKQERGEFAYEVRAARTHMSVERAEDWFRANAPEGAQLVLMHQHKDN